MNYYGVIYKIKNMINDKIYIGQTTNSFDTRYHNNLEKRTDNDHLKKAIHKYGIQNFEIYKIFDVAFSKEELDIKEQCWINYYKSADPNYGYNKMTGGGKYGTHSKEIREKMSRIMKTKMKEVRKNISEEEKQRLREINIGRKLSEEHKRKISQTMKSKVAEGGVNICNVGKSNKGRKLSDETKKKISKAKQNISKETRRKMSLSSSGGNNSSAKITYIYDNNRNLLYVAECRKEASQWLVDNNIINKLSYGQKVITISIQEKKCYKGLLFSYEKIL